MYRPARHRRVIGSALAVSAVLVCGGGDAAGIDPGNFFSGAGARQTVIIARQSEIEIVDAQGGILPEPGELAALAEATRTYAYYGAVAWSPDEGLIAATTAIASDYHNTEAATAAALHRCETLRRGVTPCSLLALVRPEGWTPRPLQMSQTATLALAESIADDVSLALSPGTRAFKLMHDTGARSARRDAAVAACTEMMHNEQAALLSYPPQDCSVVVDD